MTRLTLDNYKVVYKDYSLDIQDEIRSAILDSLSLEEHVDRCRKRPYLLNQIRLAMKEEIPEVYLDLPWGSVLYRVRQIWRTVDCRPLLEYGSTLGEADLNTVMDWLELGADLSKYNLTRLPKSVYPSISRGLAQGYPMQLFADGKEYSFEYVQLVYSMIQRGIQVGPYLNEIWREDSLTVIVEHTHGYTGDGTSLYEKVIPYISSESRADFVERLFDAAVLGVDPAKLVSLLSFQIAWVIDAVEKGLDYTSMLDPALGNPELGAIITKLQYEGRSTQITQVVKRKH